MFASCPNCYGPLNKPLSNGLQLCKKCGWKGRDVAVRRPAKPAGRDIGLDAIAAVIAFCKRPINLGRLQIARTRPTGNGIGGWIALPLLFLALAVTPVMSYMGGQRQAGHPIDSNYFWAAIDPRNWLGPYNGAGGKDWKIGEPLTNWADGFKWRTLSEERAFALRLVNRDRALNGMQALGRDPILDAAAQRHALDMLRRSYFAHESPEGGTPKSRYVEAGGNPRAGVGENIYRVTGDRRAAVDFNAAEAFQKGWMYSDGHRQNLLNPSYRRFGYGVVAEPLGGRVYAVQEFAFP